MTRVHPVQMFFVACAAFALILPAHAAPPAALDAARRQLDVVAPDAGSMLPGRATALRLSHRSIAGIKLLGQQARIAEARVDPGCIAKIHDDAAAAVFEDYFRANFSWMELANLDAFYGSPLGIKFTSAVVENTLTGGQSQAASVMFTIIETYKVMAFLASPAGSRLAYLELEPDSNMDAVLHSLMPLLLFPCMTKPPEPVPAQATPSRGVAAPKSAMRGVKAGDIRLGIRRFCEAGHTPA